MKIVKSKSAKMFAVSAAFLGMVSAASVQAGSVSLGGHIDWIDVSFPVAGLTSGSPVSLDLFWDDAAINAIGGTDLEINGAPNSMLFTVGPIHFSEADRYIDLDDPSFSDLSPRAHFTDGILDGVLMNFFLVPAEFDGVVSEWSPIVTWNYDVNEGIFRGNSGNYFEIIDENTFTFVEGEFDVASAPVPVPGAFWLLGSALIGLAARLRGRRS
ncbi:MAG: hypothetical protein HY885_10230 [Deltaproteobacteria bacterium]|nr:hypothetical protein [Deltaproteobacteria bacterium]